MSPSEVQLRSTAAEVTAGADLPVQIDVTHRGHGPLSGARVELTLEIERGVLLTWNIELKPVPPGLTEVHPVAACDPPYRLPSNTEGGAGVFRARLFGPDGAQLAEDELAMPVTSTTSPS